MITPDPDERARFFPRFGVEGFDWRARFPTTVRTRLVDLETEAIDESTVPGVSGYRHFMQQLVAQTEQFKGQVLFVHGDTHFFKLDKPLHSPGKLLPNLTRLQTFGSPSLHWIKVTVDPAADSLFQVQPVIVAQP